MDCLSINFEEVRMWSLFILAIIGGFISVKTFMLSVKQRKLENTYRTIDFLRNHISKEQINDFIELFHANNELSGVKYNEFKLADGRIDTIENMFSEGGCGNGSIHNMIELFNLISPTLKRLEMSIIWFEYGQIMSKIYQWTEYLVNNSDYSIGFCSEFNIFMKKHQRKFLNKPIKFYTYAE